MNEIDENNTESKQKRIFITGGASGLGKAIAFKFASHGYKVCIGDIHDERGEATVAELIAQGTEAFYIHCDTTKFKQLDEAREHLEVRWQGVDVVVNNAGVGGTAGPIEDVSLADWDWVMNINLMGVVRGCKAFTPLFKEQCSGHFVNISSAAGLLSAPLMSSYNVSKAGVISLSETLSAELADYNIGTSVVCPAFFKTNLTESLRSTIKGIPERISSVMARSKVTADDVADAIFDAVNKNTFWVVTHKNEKRLWQWKRFFPSIYQAKMKKQMKKLFK